MEVVPIKKEERVEVLQDNLQREVLIELRKRLESSSLTADQMIHILSITTSCCG